MPWGTRNKLKTAARVTRANGEVVMLLIPEATPPHASATPFSITADNTPDVKNAISIPIYASVHYAQNAEYVSGEAGRSILGKITVEAELSWRGLMTKAYAIKTNDGMIYRKTAENIDDSRSLYILHAEGWIGIVG